MIGKDLHMPEKLQENVLKKRRVIFQKPSRIF